MTARAWVFVSVAGFWMAVLGVLVSDGGLAAIGAIVCGGAGWVAYDEGRGE